MYVLLIDLYYQLLDSTKPLRIFDPAVIYSQNTRNAPNEVVEIPAADLNVNTSVVREKLKAALFNRFYKRYHPMKAYCKVTDFFPTRVVQEPKDSAEQKVFLFSYLLDIQAVFHPKLSNMQLMKLMVFSFNDVSNDVKLWHFTIIRKYVWCTIKQLAEQVAYHMLRESRLGGTYAELDCQDNVIHVVSPQPAKEQKVADPIMAMLDSMINEPAVHPTLHQSSEVSAKDVVEEEIKHYLEIEDSPEFDDTIAWWTKRTNCDRLPCLSQVALAFLACKPSSGGLECDFGLLKDVLSPKRASLGQGFVEVEMMLKLNKHLLLSNPTDIPVLSNKTWKEFILQHPKYDFDDDDSDADSTHTANNIGNSVQDNNQCNHDQDTEDEYDCAGKTADTCDSNSNVSVCSEVCL